MRGVVDPVTRREIRWRVWQQLPLLLVLVLLWMLLWGSLTPLTVITGVVAAFGVTRAFYLPPVELSGRFNPLRFAVFLAFFAAELVVGSFQVALTAFGPRAGGRSSVIAVQLATRSDFVTTLTAITVSLIPGSIVIEVDREAGVLYLHALGVDTPAALARARRQVQHAEVLLVRALGSRDDLGRLES